MIAFLGEYDCACNCAYERECDYSCDGFWGRGVVGVFGRDGAGRDGAGRDGAGRGDAAAFCLRVVAISCKVLRISKIKKPAPSRAAVSKKAMGIAKINAKNPGMICENAAVSNTTTMSVPSPSKTLRILL